MLSELLVFLSCPFFFYGGVLAFICVVFILFCSWFGRGDEAKNYFSFLFASFFVVFCRPGCPMHNPLEREFLRGLDDLDSFIVVMNDDRGYCEYTPR